MITFTREELQTYEKKSLQRLAKYLEIEYNYRTKKDELIELIFEKYGYVSPEDKLQEIGMSVRIARIHGLLEE